MIIILHKMIIILHKMIIIITCVTWAMHACTNSSTVTWSETKLPNYKLQNHQITKLQITKSPNHLHYCHYDIQDYYALSNFFVWALKIPNMTKHKKHDI